MMMESAPLAEHAATATLSCQAPVLEVADLTVEFPARRGTRVAIDRGSIRIEPGEILGVVGESGAGKSITGLAVPGLLEGSGRIAGGEIRVGGRRIDSLPDEALSKIRGRGMGAIFQDPLTALTYLFISHDLSVVRHMSDTVAVMYLGRIVETAPAESLFGAPQPPYSRLLLGTIPDIHAPRRMRDLQSGEPPSPLNPPPGCTFHPRCSLSDGRCRSEPPEFRSANGVAVRCHAVEEGRAHEDSIGGCA